MATSTHKHSVRQAGIFGLLERIADRIDTRHLALVVGVLFAVDFVVPDPLPFIDEIILGSLTILLARWQSRPKVQEPAEDPAYSKPPPKNVTPHN